MQIASIAYASPEEDALAVTLSDGQVLHAPSPVRTWQREVIEAWLAEGNEIQPYVAAPDPVPDATPLQLFDELDETHGIDLEAEVGALSQKALRRLRLSNSIRRTDQFAAGLQAKLGWTDEQVDALFRAAAAR